MDLLPISVVSRDQDVPISNSEFTFCIQKYGTKSFTTGTLALNGSTTKMSQVFILGISVGPQELLDTTPMLNLIDDISLIGTLCELSKLEETDKHFNVTCQILAKVFIRNITHQEGTIFCPVEFVNVKELSFEKNTLETLKNTFRYLLRDKKLLPEAVAKRVFTTPQTYKIANLVAPYLLDDKKDKYTYLQLQNITSSCNFILNRLLIWSEVQMPVAVPAIPKVSKTTSLEEKLLAIQAPESTLSTIRIELERLKKLQSSSVEYQSAYEYLNWVAELPWGITTYTPFDLRHLRPTLDKTHYGLGDIKDYILEYMTIEQLKGISQGTILCFSGPPATGKTSIAKAIATATNRKLVKIALGGISDESEIRGHRRTYVAARPGRIISGLRSVGTSDPLFLLDEVDKLDKYRGDPAAALLELLDPEQNNEFMDRYLELPFDLSKAMFICTANYLEQIPEPLRDRLEIIEFREYNQEERYEITKQYLLPSAIKEYSLDNLSIQIDNNIYEELSKLTSIRDINRAARKALRRAAVEIVVNQQDTAQLMLDPSTSTHPTRSRIGF